MNDAAITTGDYMANNMTINAYTTAVLAGSKSNDDGDTLEELRNAAADAVTDNAGAFDMKGMQKADDKTFSNAALQVGFGSFSFGVVYATNDGGAYKVESMPIVVNANADITPTLTAQMCGRRHRNPRLTATPLPAAEKTRLVIWIPRPTASKWRKAPA